MGEIKKIPFQKVLNKLEMYEDILTMLSSKFKFEIIENKHKYDGITEPYILFIKMKDDDSFVCCGIDEGMFRRLKSTIGVVINLEPQKSVYTMIEELLKENPEVKYVTIDSYENLGGKK